MANQADLPVRTMCRVLGVSASGFYAWRERAPSQRSIANAVMTERIRQIHQDSYGMPRVRAKLIEQGVCISRQCVARLMRQAGIHGISKRRGITVAKDGKRTPSGPMICCLVEMAYLTGQRASDPLPMEWSEIGKTDIRFQPGKTPASTGAEVLIGWTPRLEKLVARLKTFPHTNMRYPVPHRDASVPAATLGHPHFCHLAPEPFPIHPE